MKIAVTSQGPDLDSAMDQRFGRCPYVLIVETEDLSFEVVKNPYAEESGGVGSRLASLVAGRGVQAVLTGTVGPNARQALDAAKISIVESCTGTVRQAVEAIKNGQPLTPPALSAATTSATGGGGLGRGGGKGLGRGRGRGVRLGGEQRRQRRERRRWFGLA